jgi:DNA-binding transcriptional LysR family regulator
METISRHLDDLTAFHVVANAGSFTRASEQLGWSKALLSKQVKRLEACIGSQLFHRTTRSVRLTEEGAVLLNYSQKIFDLSNEASRRIHEMTQGSAGHVRISVPNSVGDVFFPSFLSHVKTVLPHVKFEVELSNENKDFSKERIDFAIRASEDHHPDLIARYLGRIKDVICVSHGFLKKTKINNDPKNIKNHECILNSLNVQWNTWTFQSEMRELRVEVSGTYATNQYRMARSLCLDGFGVAKIPLYMVADDLKNGSLVQLFPEYEIATHPLYLMYLKSEFTSKKHKLVKDIILKWFKERKCYFIRFGIQVDLF